MIKPARAASGPSSRTALALALLALGGGLAVGGCGKKKGKAAAAPAATAPAPRPPPPVTPTTPPAVPTTAPAITTAGGAGVPSCDEFLALIDKAIACDKLASSRPALEANRDGQKRRFASWAAMNDGARAAALTEAAGQCKGGVDGMRTTLASAGCVP